jgi:DNA-binding HxlR family transcriptional regulator
LSAAVSRNSAKPDRLVSQRILVLSNLLRRAAGLRYRRPARPAGRRMGRDRGARPSVALHAERPGGPHRCRQDQLSRTVSRLTARGLVRRKPNPRDNREVRLSLTPKGQDCHAGIMRAGRSANLSLLADLSARERKQLVALIERVTVRARDLLRAEAP